ncbi:MAG: dihydrolipoyl dehydrogenase, partial [Candidatus Latescibacteria bacterium]|nr:dihydrolipoyl dehydrogenase [bacterium]MBD3423363.1 dihydrolipoyl dehydrogenase [Candidatus Latescibacterota bacterium]
MNFGCLPSKTLLYPAEKTGEIIRAQELEIRTGDIGIDFAALMERVRKEREKRRRMHKKQLEEFDNVDYYRGEGHFISSTEVEVEENRIAADRIFIANGARPLIPPVEGLDKVDYLTNETILEIRDRPESMAIIGGGYIALEYAYFLSSCGVDVTIIEMNGKLLPGMEPEISEMMEEQVGSYCRLHLNARAEKVLKEEDGLSVEVSSGEEKITVNASRLLVAAGRRSNADTLSLEQTAIRTDEAGYIVVDEYMETGQPGVFAFGDI